MSVLVSSRELVTGRRQPRPSGPASTEPQDRFWRFLIADNEMGACWEWAGARFETGYGSFWDGTRNAKAHRWAYEHFVGPVPHGLDLDHLCRNRACVRPDHLEPVTRSVNVRRGYAARLLSPNKEKGS